MPIVLPNPNFVISALRGRLRAHALPKQTLARCHGNPVAAPRLRERESEREKGEIMSASERERKRWREGERESGRERGRRERVR